MRPPPAKIRSAGGNTPPWRRGVHLKGPRPPPLTINNEPRKIRKPPKAAEPPVPENRAPVVIYAVSPETIIIDASEFKSIVQRLTGLGSTAPPPFAGGPVSPAARIAAIEKASPTGREREREKTTITTEIELDLVGTVDLGRNPGILSPAPENLPGVPTGVFTPAVESQAPFGLGENLMSPFEGSYYIKPSLSSSPGFFTGGVGVSSTPSPVLDFSTIFNS